MARYKELSYEKLKRFFDLNEFDFETTEDLIPLEEIIGQQRAVKAMEFGLQVKNSKYNIFVTGLKGVGKTSYTQRVINEKAKEEKIPDDWCYVYNFEEPSNPIALNMPPGMGKALSKDMDVLTEELLVEIPKAFSSEDYERRKTEIVKKYQEERNKLLDDLTDYSKKSGFSIKNTSMGFVISPLVDGEPITDKEYDELESEEKNAIEKKAEELQNKAVEILRKIKGLERQAKKSIKELDNTVALFVVKPMMDELYERYKKHEKIVEFIKVVQKDVIENIYDFNISEDDQEAVVVKKAEDSFLKKYKVNLLVDNSSIKGAPVIMEFNPTYSNLVGKIEYENESTTLKTNFLMIKPGSIHKANGGYLILQADHVLRNSYVWETLKRTIETGELAVESLRSQLGIVDIASLKPEPIPIDIKIIMIGNPYLYQLLHEVDEDFEKLFKIKVDFDSVMESKKENEQKIARFIRSYCEKEGLLPFDKSGAAKIIEFSHRITGTQKKLSTRFNKIIEILIEADGWARMENCQLVKADHVEKAYQERIFRHNKLEEKIDEMYQTGKIIIDVHNRKVGRINGLSVIDLGDHVFGKPSVISVTTCVGNRGIVNIEREVKMSGSIHDKGVMILEGYLNQVFAQDNSLSLTAKICFEQLYSGVDGDSASGAELFALLSSLSEVAIKQNIAVTGSVNQMGEIQPVGGASEKIEGFFTICKHLGLNGKQGVIIPRQNIDDLVLHDEVIDAVKNGQFHIYPISTVEEGMEILTDRHFEDVLEKVKKKLEHYNCDRKNGHDRFGRKTGKSRLFIKK
ncbi:MAG: Lon protease family protein [Bacillota bacterium]